VLDRHVRCSDHAGAVAEPTRDDAEGRASRAGASGCYQIGVLAATYISEQLKCQGNVVEIQGLAGISVTTDRTKGFTDTLKQNCPGGGIKIVASQPGDVNPDKGLTVMENILQAQKSIGTA
jgi:ribose transport system substrate-binding protein